MSEDGEAVLLVMLLKRTVLCNTRHLCPLLSTILINTYRDTSELFVDSRVFWSEE